MDISVLRLIDNGAGEAFYNMNRDVELFTEVEAGLAPSTVRFYTWEKPSITIGKFQDTGRTLNVAECERLQVPIVRRPTGGRGILHGDDLTVSVCGSLSALGFSSDSAPSIQSIYFRLSEMYLRAFEKLGVSAKIGEGTQPRVSNHYGDCFLIANSADLVCVRTGRKLLGSALLRRGEYVLQQVSIPLYAGASYYTLGERLFVGGSGLDSGGAWLDCAELRGALIEAAREFFSLCGGDSHEKVFAGF